MFCYVLGFLNNSKASRERLLGGVRNACPQVGSPTSAPGTGAPHRLAAEGLLGRFQVGPGSLNFVISLVNLVWGIWGGVGNGT